MSTNRIARFSARIFCLFFSLGSLHAAGIRFLPWDDMIAARKIGFQNGTEVIPIENLHPDKRTDTVTWTSGEIPPQLVALDRTDPEGKPVTVPLKLTTGMVKPLVLILPDPKHPTGLRCFAIEDASNSFKWGAFRFINATGKELLVRNDKVTKALPKTWKPVDLDPGGAVRNMGIQMAARDNLTAILYSAVWEYDPNIRKLVIVIPGVDADKGAVNLKVIPEDRRTVAAAAPVTSAQAP